MDKDIHDIDGLISKYLTHEASADEVVRVEDWIGSSEENRKYFDQVKTVYVKAEGVKEYLQFDTDAAWLKVKANLKKKSESPTIPLHPRRESSNTWIYRIAAGIVLVVGVGLYFFFNQSNNIKPVEVIAKQNSVTDTLPGGSEVVLNKKTTLKYAFDKKKKEHKVKLKGEAYFNVRHDEGERFLVEANGVYIRDIGTSFNVKAYPDTDIVEVVVEEGEVVFFTEENPGIHLQASGKGVYNKKTRVFSIEQPEPNVLAYKTKFFIFSSTPLGDVARELNSVYDTKLIVPANLQHCEVTVSFHNESVEEIASIIAETLNLSTVISGKSIQLEGAGCE